MSNLNSNTSLQGGKYLINEKLGQGGFGITYLATQIGLDRKVAIKEFFMREFCVRDENASHVTIGTEECRDTVNRFRGKFLKEARNIARLNHPNIVRIIDVFEENGTAYYVMEYAENGSLADKVKREGFLTESVATRYILQVASALDYIHQLKMSHLDIKPSNIMLNEKDEVILIDFGLAKQYDAVTCGQTSTTPIGISEGYAPVEQYMTEGVKSFSPEIDVYALGATYFKLLTGVVPPNASQILKTGIPDKELLCRNVSESAQKAIALAMVDRCSSISSFKNVLLGNDKQKASIEKTNLLNNQSAGNLSMIGNHSNSVLVNKYKGYEFITKWKKPMFVFILKGISLLASGVFFVIFVLSTIDLITVEVDYDNLHDDYYFVRTEGCIGLLQGSGWSDISENGKFSKKEARRKSFGDYYEIAFCLIIFVISGTVVCFIMIYLLNRKLPGKKHGKISDFADCVQKYRICLFGFRDKYRFYIKNGKFGVVNVAYYTIVTEPIFDEVYWEKENELFVGVKGNEKNIYHVKKGLLL